MVSVPEPVLVSPPSPLSIPETVQAKPFELIVAPPAPIVAGTANLSAPIACKVPPDQVHDAPVVQLPGVPPPGTTS
jgi:hypothetical protein